LLVIGTTVLGVDDLQRALAFWSGALGYRPRRPPSEDWAILDPPERGMGASLALMVTRARVHLPPRIHLDLYADDQEAEVERLIELGARHIDWDRYPEGADFVVLEDTEGNRFCVIDAPGWFSRQG
jgi:catechol 2,3-dioxygenase-like lactoylglutathione lyase family enzyme